MEENKNENFPKIFTEDYSLYPYEKARTYIIAYEYSPLHSHDFIEFFYVLRGTSGHFNNGQKQIIKPGDSFLFPLGVSHQFVLSDNNFIHRDIIFRKNFFKSICDFYQPGLYEKFVQGQHPFYASISSHRISQFEFFGSRLHKFDQSQDRREYENMLASLVVALLLERGSDKATSHKNPDWLNQLITMLSTAENFNIPLANILKHFDYAPQYIMRIFKKNTGLTLTEFFNNQKMLQAHFLLENSNLPIKAIAQQCGFHDVIYFYHCYKREFEESPKQTRLRIDEKIVKSSTK
ncbi:MAG: AraC family transcriptional regulator [Erysipelotrichaceae bacterium]|nr:AraC family transcriptional regulator [Erysipelotrichaceae bacterium]